MIRRNELDRVMLAGHCMSAPKRLGDTKAGEPTCLMNVLETRTDGTSVKIPVIAFGDTADKMLGQIVMGTYVAIDGYLVVWKGYIWNEGDIDFPLLTVAADDVQILQSPRGKGIGFRDFAKMYDPGGTYLRELRRVTRRWHIRKEEEESDGKEEKANDEVLRNRGD